MPQDKFNSMTIGKKIAEICPEGFDSYTFVNEVAGWPLIPEDSEDDTSNLEWLDTENFFVEELEDDYMVVVAGGDWQDPLQVRIELKADILVVTKVNVPVIRDWRESLIAEV